jgi:hypothetical protein
MATKISLTIAKFSGDLAKIVSHNTNKSINENSPPNSNLNQRLKFLLISTLLKK